MVTTLSIECAPEIRILRSAVNSCSNKLDLRSQASELIGMMRLKAWFLRILFVSTLFIHFYAYESVAGIFSLPHFVPPNSFSLGLETELILSNGAGFGGNLKYTHGLSELSNVTAMIGTGGGPRGFRIGGNITLDLFPDLEGQPGIGIAGQSIYYRLKDSGRLEVTAIPYIHKSFFNDKQEFEPYLALPMGVGFSSGEYKGLATISIGSLFKGGEHFRYIMEVGVAISNTESYFSGGIVYFH